VNFIINGKVKINFVSGSKIVFLKTLIILTTNVLMRNHIA
jgi:hypothetical protein